MGSLARMITVPEHVKLQPVPFAEGAGIVNCSKTMFAC
jgi:hypothetical protein